MITSKLARKHNFVISFSSQEADQSLTTNLLHQTGFTFIINVNAETEDITKKAIPQVPDHTDRQQWKDFLKALQDFHNLAWGLRLQMIMNHLPSTT